MSRSSSIFANSIIVDEWDFDAVQQLVLADLTIAGERRQVVMQANKNGFFYVLDRKTGQMISANNFTPVTWASGMTSGVAS